MMHPSTWDKEQNTNCYRNTCYLSKTDMHTSSHWLLRVFTKTDRNGSYHYDLPYLPYYLLRSDLENYMGFGMDSIFVETKIFDSIVLFKRWNEVFISLRGDDSFVVVLRNFSLSQANELYFLFLKYCSYFILKFYFLAWIKM